MTLKEIRSKISGIRSQVEELQSEAQSIEDSATGVEEVEAFDLEDALEDIAAALAEQEGDVED